MSQAEVWTGERCFITELLNDPASPEVSLARCRVPAGTTTQLHRLSVREWYIVASGQGLLRLGTEPPVAIAAGDTISVAAGTAQQVTSTGGADLVFQCLCMPRFVPECYEALE